MAAPIEEERPRSVMFSWGANSCGQLASGHKDDIHVPTKWSCDHDDIRSICGGGGHTFVISEGEVKSCGCNSKGQLGQGHNQEVTVLQKLPFFTGIKVKKISAGWDFTILLTGDGAIYSWGSNTFGQLGTPHIQNNSSVPNCVESVRNAVDIAAGLRHALAVTEAGSVLSWGAGKKGQLGVLVKGKSPAMLPTPTRVPLRENIGHVTSCVSGSYHSAVLTDVSGVLVWGCNKHGQATKVPSESSSFSTPILISAHYFHHLKILRIFSGWTHMLAYTEDGQVYSWGRNDYGQLGRLSSGSCVPNAAESGPHSSHHTCSKYDHTPQPIVNLKSATQICCGSEHNLALLEDGKLVSWGWNEHGICGLGHEENVAQPTVVDGVSHPVLLIGCGAGHSFALCKT